MNVRSLDLVIRTLTTSALALGVLAVTAYEAIGGHDIAEPFAAWGGIIIGVYFGAHVSQNGSSSRARGDQILVAETIGNPIPPDDHAPSGNPHNRNG